MTRRPPSSRRRSTRCSKNATAFAIPPPGKERLQGADATHAWVSLWCGDGLGWIGFDPTNDILVENDHIVLAVGRDFSDVSPVDGIIVGSRKQKLNVAVDVLLVE
jgi:transglutaminase-like putative cysteine protease